MEMSMAMHMNPNVKQRFDKHNLSSKNPRKVPTISCQVAMQNKTNTNFYQLLSLSSTNVGVDEIKKAYRSMALHYHPDACTCSDLTKDESTRKFIEIRNAYETLSDPKSRQIYDCELGLSQSRKVWERQLHGLRKRCDEIMRKRRYEEFM